MTGVAEQGEGWILRHRGAVRRSARMLFGFVWGIDAALAFFPQTPFWFSESVLAASIGQPSYLSGWYAFWVVQAQQYAALDVGVVTFLELALCVSLILGLLRKTAYLGGIGLSLFIWAVPNGFGGPYNVGTFDVGVGVIYAIAFLFLLVLDADPSAKVGTVDGWIERRWPGWARWAEVSSSVYRLSERVSRRPHEVPATPPDRQNP